MNASSKTTKTKTRQKTRATAAKKKPVTPAPGMALRVPRATPGGWTVAAALLSPLAACAPEMDPASLVEKTRVLGARVDVDGAPGRATPQPGEAVTVSWLVTAPRELPAIGWAFALCAGRGSEAGCGEAPLALFQGRDPSPALRLRVPDAAALGSARELTLFGRVCAGSEPTFEAASGRPGCTMNGDGTTALLSIPLALGDGPNHNPALAGRALWLDGQPWQPAAGEGCAALPQVKAGSEGHVLRLETMGEDRERYTVLEGDPPQPTPKREPLQISQFTTDGKLERSVSAIEGEDSSERPAVEVKWTAPDAAKVGDAGLVVRFTFVARDLRGGVDWTERAVCVVR
jgi:hypothetical protein